MPNQVDALPDKQPAIRVIAMPPDTNQYGDIFGGWVGDVVSFYATVIKVGNTSITVDVEVYAERLHKDNHRIVKVTEAKLVFVALDKNGRPQPVYRPDNPNPDSNPNPEEGTFWF